MIASPTTLLFDEALLPGGWARQVRLHLAAGRITAVEPDATPGAGEPRHQIGLPGLPNLHSHAFQRAMAGLTETRGPAADSFWTWREVMYRFLGRMTPDDVQAVAAQAYAEMLEGGFTHVGEFHYLHHQPDGSTYAEPAEMAVRIAAAAAQTCIGLTLLPVFYAHGGFGGADPSPGQRRFLNDLDGFARLLAGSQSAVAALPGAVVGIAPHSLRAATPGELAELAAIAPGTPLHIHVAEQTREVEDCLAWSGQRPVEWLLDHTAVDGRWCLIHATHMTEIEVTRLATTGAVAGLCPVTEANLGDGVFPGVSWQQAGGRIGVGTDSNVLIGAADELREMEYAQRLTGRARNVLAGVEGVSTGRALFDAALSGGARAMGCEQPILRVGAPADIVALDADHPALMERHGDALLNGWIFAANRPAVRSVWMHGQQVVADGRHIDRTAITNRFRQTLRTLLGN
ncbi:formimidoylglutamate deiminase [Acidisphaera sp. L21]|uniref:formimidoylglutamate deiminase n=1 Tax=Acidisphaera sp. L21 TaxID=1641851 RepID=UPI00131CB62B|nr:formimidoylglutamate deiminase [Acidisphaera sp. L21]